MIDDQHPLGVGVGFLEVVSGQHDGGLLPFPQSADVLPEVGPIVRIHPG
jgi:hypothetical protein